MNRLNQDASCNPASPLEWAGVGYRDYQRRVKYRITLNKFEGTEQDGL